MNRSNDRAPAKRRRSLSTRLTTWTVNKVLKAAEDDIVLTETLHRVASLIDQPNALLNPGLIPRVIKGNLKHRRAVAPQGRQIKPTFGRRVTLARRDRA